MLAGSEAPSPPAPTSPSSATGRRRANVVGTAFRAAFDARRRDPAAGDRGGHGLRARRWARARAGCDLRIAGDTARLGQPEILLGIIPGGGRHAAAHPPRRSGAGEGADLERSPGAGRRGARDRARRPRRAGRRARGRRRSRGRPSSRRARSSRWGSRSRRSTAGSTARSTRGLDVEAEAFVEVFGTEDARDRRRELPRARPRQGHLPGPLSVAASVSARSAFGRGGGRGWRARCAVEDGLARRARRPGRPSTTGNVSSSSQQSSVSSPATRVQREPAAAR